jgi:hypothetical protein
MKIFLEEVGTTFARRLSENKDFEILASKTLLLEYVGVIRVNLRR